MKRSQDRNLEAGTESHPAGSSKRMLGETYRNGAGPVSSDKSPFPSALSFGDSGLGPRAPTEVRPLRTTSTTPCFEVEIVAGWLQKADLSSPLLCFYWERYADYASIPIIPNCCHHSSVPCRALWAWTGRLVHENLVSSYSSFYLFKKIVYFMHLGILPECMSVHCVCARYSCWPEEGIR